MRTSNNNLNDKIGYLIYEDIKNDFKQAVKYDGEYKSMNEKIRAMLEEWIWKHEKEYILSSIEKKLMNTKIDKRTKHALNKIIESDVRYNSITEIINDLILDYLRDRQS